MANQKPYKLEYKFIGQLRDLLTGEDWRIHHIERIDQIQELLSHSPEAEALELREEKGDRFTDEHFHRKVTSDTKKQDEAKEEMAQLKANLDKGTYTMGIAPFETKEDAQQMLKVLHILEIDSERYNQEAVVAIRNMLSENFADLYTPEIGVKVLATPEVISAENGGVIHEEYSSGQRVIINLTDKILRGESISIEDFVGLAAPIEEMTPDTINSINIAINGLRSINPEELTQILETLNFVTNFYKPGHFLVHNQALTLAILFHSAENLERFFAKFVDFSTIESFEQAFPTSTITDFSLLSAEELSAWRVLMVEYGPKAIALFGRANSLAGINAASLIAESGIEQAFKTIKSAAIEVAFNRESENPELAKLCHKYDISETVFNQTLSTVIPRRKASDDLPDINFEFSVDSHNYRFEKLQPGDLNGLFLGKMTDCCQFIDGHGQQCAIDGFTREDAGFYVIRDEKGRIKAQSYAWIGVVDDGSMDAIIFDSFEYLKEAKETFLPAMQGYKARLAMQKAPFIVAVGTGGKTPHVENSEKYRDVKPKNSDLSQYRDSSEVITITPYTEIPRGIPAIEASIKTIAIDSYQDLVSKCPRLTSKALKEKYPDEITAIKESGVMLNLHPMTNIALFLIEEGILDIETIINIARSRPNIAEDLSYYNSKRQEYYKQLFLQCKEQGMTDQEKIIEFVFSEENEFRSWKSTKTTMTTQAKLVQASEVEESEDADTQSASVATEVAPPAISETPIELSGETGVAAEDFS
jgi:hypothetical protein